MTGGVARPRGTCSLDPLRLGSIWALIARYRLAGTGLVDPARHTDPTPAAPVAGIGRAVTRHTQTTDDTSIIPGSSAIDAHRSLAARR